MKKLNLKLWNRVTKLEKSVLCAFLTAIIAMSATSFTVFAQQCDDIRDKVFRLHILANSDSAADQALKLKVRDQILAVSGDLFATTGDKAQAEETVKENLSRITQIAQQEVQQEGYTYQVTAHVVNMYFTTRTYGNVTLPAGYYDALRIEIGAAKGHNWWCVLFPPLCLPSAQGKEKMDDVLSTGECGIVTNGGQSVVIKFKVVELYESAKKNLQSVVAQFSSPKKK
jgi:stage II sporulation protein R